MTMPVDPFLSRDSVGPVGWCTTYNTIPLHFNAGLSEAKRSILRKAITDMFALAGLRVIPGEDFALYRPTSIGCPDAPVNRSILVVALPKDDPLWQQWRADAWASNAPMVKYAKGYEYNGGSIVVNPVTPKKYLRTIGLHEAGHLLGLAHRPGAGKSIMNTYPDVSEPSESDKRNIAILGNQCRQAEQ